MLNPSTADDVNDDPTIKSCVRLAKHNGFGGLKIVNLYTVRATNPNELKAMDQKTAMGSNANEYILESCDDCMHVVAAWGNFKYAKRRANDVLIMLKNRGIGVMCFGVNKDGSPKHPLYIKSDTLIQEYKP
jgi:hypothetical protein